MILYLDTSALVKAYVSEAFSENILEAMEQAKIVATHPIAYVEAHAAFARIKREKKITQEEHELIKKNFRTDWINFLLFHNNEVLLEHAANLADVLLLRAYDSIHLAAADLLAKKSKIPVTFACFDLALNKSAHVLGLILLTAHSPFSKVASR
ncbi:MAG TPA: type II toxin-antitoxin system VapC family toxin [Gammaproteobacteria bacterium]|nr:type II toxin-antitoxin system VapC family toxin [Gammaproteobacteria bacterium]